MRYNVTIEKLRTNGTVAEATTWKLDAATREDAARIALDNSVLAAMEYNERYYENMTLSGIQGWEANQDRDSYRVAKVRKAPARKVSH